MNAPALAACPPTTRAAGGYVAGNKSRHEAAAVVCQRFRRQRPPTLQHLVEGSLVSIPAPGAGGTPPQPRPGAPVTHPHPSTDQAALLAAAAVNPAVSDRAMRVYTVVVTLDQEVTAALVAAHLPALTEAQAGRLLGDLTSAGLLRKRLRTIGYRDGNRVRRSAYTLVRGVA